MITLARPIMTTASLIVLTMGTSGARAAESCSAYPTGTAENIESSDLASKLGAVPKPGKELRFAYVTKTLINEFWQDVAAGAKSEAAKYGIKVDVQAAKDELSLVEQLNLAQTMASQKPDALLLSPESDLESCARGQGCDCGEHPDGNHRRLSNRRRQLLHRHRPGEDRRTGRNLPARGKSERR